MTRKELALEYVDRFQKTNGIQFFTAFNRGQIAVQLKQRIQNPSLIDQGSSYLCGVAAIVYGLACERPDKYARAVIDLFERGYTSLGDADKWWSRWILTAGDHLRAYSPQGAISGADWILMASIRNSENFLLEYGSAKDGAARGGTPPSDLEKWLRKLGYDQVINRTNGFFQKDEMNLLDADRRYSEGFRVFLQVHADVLTGPGSESPLWYEPNHWVVLTSSVRVWRDKYQLQVYSWGSTQPVYQSPKLNIGKDQFLDAYFGFVAAKY